MKNRFFFLGLLALLPITGLANTIATGSISVNNNDNIPNAAGDANIFGDSYAEANIELGKVFTPAAGQNLTLRVKAQSRSYQHTSGLNRLDLGAGLNFTQRFGLGAYAPRLKIFLNWDQLNFRENLRDGEKTTLGFGFEKRITPALRIESDIQYENRNGRGSNAAQYNAQFEKDVFSQENSEFKAALEYTFENYSSLTFQYRYRDGEANTTTLVGSGLAAFSKAIAYDPALGNNRVVYLLNSTSQTYALNWSYPLSNDMAFDLAYEKRLADAEGNNKYRSTIMSAQITYRFK